MNAATRQPDVLIHVDMDSLWALREAYSLSASSPEASVPDPVFMLAMRRFLDVFQEYDIPASFFVCGQDCTPAAHADLIREARQHGHEIASHSYSHKIGLHAMGRKTIHDELLKSVQAISNVCGERPVGFRMPGFGLNPEVAACLAECGFRYESSMLPTSISGLMRFVSRFIGASGDSEKNRYGGGGELSQRFEPYRIELPEAPENDSASLIELPVAVSPLLHLPLHASVSITAGWIYTQCGLKRLLRRREVIVYLFHGIDLVGANEVEGLPTGLLQKRLFPESVEKKERFVRRILDLLTRRGKVFHTIGWLDLKEV